MYSADHFSDGQTLLVGDAASFLDPVSSFGVKKALATTNLLLGLYIVNTDAWELW
jgi:flavin-dependent dehydrogenase